MNVYRITYHTLHRFDSAQAGDPAEPIKDGPFTTDVVTAGEPTAAIRILANTYAGRSDEALDEGVPRGRKCVGVDIDAIQLTSGPNVLLDPALPAPPPVL